MVDLRSCVAALVLLPALGCTMANPEFSDRGLAEHEDSEGEAEGDPSESEGSTTEAESSSSEATGEATGSSEEGPLDTGEETPLDESELTDEGLLEECEEPGGGFMAPCDFDNPECPDGLFCFVLFDGMNNHGYCSPICETAEDCTWGSEAQCFDPEFACVQGQIPEKRCTLYCSDSTDCYGNQYCNLDFGLCMPL